MRDINIQRLQIQIQILRVIYNITHTIQARIICLTLYMLQGEVGGHEAEIVNSLERCECSPMGEH